MDIEYLRGDEPFDYEQLNRNFRALAESSGSDIFFAQYGVSTNAEIWAAKQAGKLVVCNDFKFSGDLVDYYTFVLYAVVENKAWFISFYDNNNAPVYFSIICENDEWKAQEEEQLTTEVIQKMVLIPRSRWTTTTTATQCTITVTGLKAYMVVIVAPRKGFEDIIRNSYIRCVSRADTQLTFQCDTLPTKDVYLDILLVPRRPSATNGLIINTMDKPAPEEVFMIMYDETHSEEFTKLINAVSDGKVVVLDLNDYNLGKAYYSREVITDSDVTVYFTQTVGAKTNTYTVKLDFSSGEITWNTVLDENDVFYATYDTTTNAEIEAAYQAGKAVFVKIGVDVVPMYTRYDATAHYFITPLNSLGGYREFRCVNDAWTTDSYTAIPTPIPRSAGQYLKYDGSAWVAADAPGGGGGSGTSKRYATKVIGTSLAGYTADDVDYLCDGTNDHNEINAALAAAARTGGEVLLLEGTYNVAGTIYVRGKTTLRGSGIAATLIVQADTAEDSDCIVIGSNATISDFAYKRSTAIAQHHTSGINSGSYARVSNIRLYGNKNICLLVAGTDVIVEKCTLVSSSGNASSVGVHINGDRCTVQNCHIDNAENVAITVNSFYTRIESNHVVAQHSQLSNDITGILLTDASYTSVIGNKLDNIKTDIRCDGDCETNTFSQNEAIDSTTFYTDSTNTSQSIITSNNVGSGSITLNGNSHMVCANICGTITNSGTGNIIIQGAST